MNSIMAGGRPRTKKRSQSLAGTFCERLVKMRNLRGLSQSDLAIRAGISKSVLSRLESFVRDSTEAETVLRLSDALGVRPEWLWWGRGPTEPDQAERRFNELRRKVEKADVEDSELAGALKKAKSYHQVVVTVAGSLASRGERHTVTGWIARLDEIQEQLRAVLPR